MGMTLEDFIDKLKELFREAEECGLDTEQMCEVAEFVIQDGWQEETDG